MPGNQDKFIRIKPDTYELLMKYVAVLKEESGFTVTQSDAIKYAINKDGEHPV